MLRWRPLAVGGAMLARLGLIDAVASWPSALRPTVALDMGDRTSKAWIMPLLPARARSLGFHPRAWQSARARALVVPRGESVLVATAERALGRTLVQPRVSLYSSSECLGKVTFFIGEANELAPTVVVKAMGKRSDGWWLRREVHNLRTVRRCLSGHTAEALLDAPLFAGEAEDEYLVVEAYGLLEGWGERSEPLRERAHLWLHDFRRATTRQTAAWRRTDTEHLVATILSAWGLLRPSTAGGVADAAKEALGRMHGMPLARCAVHGDFSPCNLAKQEDQLKVLDWEWASLEGAPYFDLWSYELGELHSSLARGRARAADLEDRLERSLRYVERQLEIAGIDRGFALGTMAAVLAELIIRFRRVLGQEGMWERSSDPVMAAVERTIERHPAPGQALAASHA